MSSLRQTPLTCSGHTRPITNLAFSEITKHGYFLISACKDGKPMLRQVQAPLKSFVALIELAIFGRAIGGLSGFRWDLNDRLCTWVSILTLVFSRVHATLQPAPSVGPSVRNTLLFFVFLGHLELFWVIFWLFLGIIGCF